MNDALIFGVASLAVGLATLAVWLWRHATPHNPAAPQTHVLGLYSPLLAWLKVRRLPEVRLRALVWPRLVIPARALAELALIGFWALWVGRAYLDFNPYTWPTGSEFGTQIQSHHFWDSVQRCGTCALWNGRINGGFPALGDSFGSLLHPVVMLTTLLWGVVVGTKLSLVVALFMAGAAQWWLARTLDLGWVARLWSSLLAVVAGHLTGRIEVGAFGLVLSIATASLTLAAAYHLARKGTRRAALLLAICGAMTLLAGQGYMQVSLAAWAPAFLFLLVNRRLQWRPVWREFALAVGLALLLAGIWLIPVLRTLPLVEKFGDPSWVSVQPLEYVPLNLVIRDETYLYTEVLQKLPYPYLYNLYIGWVPVLLALGCLRLVRRAEAPQVLSLAAGALTMLLLAAGWPSRLVAGLLPALAQVRHVPLFASLAVPAILALAAVGLDRLLALPWPRLVFLQRRAEADRDESGEPLSLSLAWLMGVPLALALLPVYLLSQNYLKVIDKAEYYAAMPALRTPTLQWVAAPFGEHDWLEPALAADLKLTQIVPPWWWRGRPSPDPALMLTRDAPPPGGRRLDLDVLTLPVYLMPDEAYASVVAESGSVPCAASGHDGHLTVICHSVLPGRLVVKEHFDPSWRAWVDHAPVPLTPAYWLALELPAGQHVIQLRYRPWDVWLGGLLTLVGLALTVRWWRLPATPS